MMIIKTLKASNLIKVILKMKSDNNLLNLTNKFPEYSPILKPSETPIIKANKALKSTLLKNKVLLLMKNKLKKNSI
jgi:chromosome segregation and condensation protein ScpB